MSVKQEKVKQEKEKRENLYKSTAQKRQCLLGIENKKLFFPPHIRQSSVPGVAVWW